MKHPLLVMGLIWGGVCAPLQVWANPPEPQVTLTPAQIAEARIHNDRAVQLFDEGNYEAAALEFQRAYELAPNYRILYNMGRSQRARNDYAMALRTFERYLADAGVELPSTRRAEVEKEIVALRTRVATLTIAVSEPGAEVAVDGDPVCGVAPIMCPDKPFSIRINPGQRKVSAQKSGFATVTRSVVALGADSLNVQIHLERVNAPQVNAPSLANTQRTASQPLPPQTAQHTPGASSSSSKTGAFIAWGITTALGATAIAFGAVSISASQELRARRAEFGVTRDTLANQASTIEQYAAITDVFAAGSLVSAVVAIYLTVKSANTGGERHSATRVPASVRPQIGLGHTGFEGSF
jgi:PEGA domain